MAISESDWLHAEKANVELMNWVHRWYHRSGERKFYLMGCAAVRQVWTKQTESQCRALIELVERYADGQATREELGRAHRAIDRELQELLDNSLASLAGSGSTGYSIPLKERAVRLAAVRAAIRAAMPGGGWEAGYSAMHDALGAGKRSEIWPRQCAMLRDLFGNPFRPVKLDRVWLSANVVSLAQAIYDQRAFERMPILADALEEAGCTSADVLTHCRQPGEHFRGCWVVDLLLDKE